MRSCLRGSGGSGRCASKTVGKIRAGSTSAGAPRGSLGRGRLIRYSSSSLSVSPRPADRFISRRLSSFFHSASALAFEASACVAARVAATAAAPAPPPRHACLPLSSFWVGRWRQASSGWRSKISAIISLTNDGRKSAHLSKERERDGQCQGGRGEKRAAITPGEPFRRLL